MKLLRVNSRTHVGRGGDVHSEDVVRAKIRTCIKILDELTPNKPILGWTDEDYGWVVSVDDAEIEQLKQRFPKSSNGLGLDHDSVYISNHPTAPDSFTVDGVETMVAIREGTGEMVFDEVERTEDAMYADWWENYGKY